MMKLAHTGLKTTVLHGYEKRKPNKRRARKQKYEELDRAPSDKNRTSETKYPRLNTLERNTGYLQDLAREILEDEA